MFGGKQIEILQMRKTNNKKKGSQTPHIKVYNYVIEKED